VPRKGQKIRRRARWLCMQGHGDRKRFLLPQSPNTSSNEVCNRTCSFEHFCYDV